MEFQITWIVLRSIQASPSAEVEVVAMTVADAIQSV